MIEISLGDRRHVALKVFRWGVYGHLRTGTVWRHWTIKALREPGVGGARRRRGLWACCWRTVDGKREQLRGIRFGFELVHTGDTKSTRGIRQRPTRVIPVEIEETPGVPYLNVVATDHAVEQATERYGGPIEGLEIVAEVALAFLQGRHGKEFAVAGGRTRRVKGQAFFAWTEDFERLYVVRHTSSARGLYVVTALPGVTSEAGITAVGLAFKRAEQREGR